MASGAIEHEPVQAREEDLPALEQLATALRSERSGSGEVSIAVRLGVETIDLPESLVCVIQQVVQTLIQREAVSIVPYHKDLTTRQAADILNVSRQYLFRLLERDEIPFHKTGTHRRIHFGDLMEYKHRRDQERRKNLARLSQKSQDLGWYS